MEKYLLKSFIITFLTIGLYYMSRINYLLFHSLAEVYSIIIAAGIFMVAWNTRKHHENDGLIFLGIAYLFVAMIDLLHTLSYQGMQIFTDYSFYANQLWVCARFMESLSLIVFVLISRVRMRIKPYIIIFIFSLITVILVSSIFVFKVFPACFIEGQGQTPFKIVSEIIICAFLGLSAFLLVRSRHSFDRGLFRLIMGSIVFTILSEVSFILYTDNYGISNVVGHLFKIISFYLIYRSVIVNTLERPFDILYQELKSSQENLKQLTEHLMERVQDQVTELMEKNKLISNQARLAMMGEMIADIAHQWKQPLNALGLVIQNINYGYSNGSLDQNKMSLYESRALTLLTHLSQTIDDFRDFFKPEKNKKEFSLKACVDKAVMLTGPVFKDKNIIFTCKIEEDEPVFGYPNELVQVLLNLINNAKDVLLEKKVANPEVTLSVFSKQDKACVSVSDNGGGIPPEIMDKIFEPYFTTRKEGTGIGLHMAKMIIQTSFGGNISVTNTEQGARFTVELNRR